LPRQKRKLHLLNATPLIKLRRRSWVIVSRVDLGEIVHPDRKVIVRKAIVPQVARAVTIGVPVEDQIEDTVVGGQRDGAVDVRLMDSPPTSSSRS
jgi:hypothetical protein